MKRQLPTFEALRPRLIRFGRPLPPTAARADAAEPPPDWQGADPRWIKRALARSQELPTGGWYVLDATRSFGPAPRSFGVAGLAVVVWRSGSQLLAARDACPHMGAALSEGRVCAGKLVCPWHGLALGPESSPGFRLLPTYDDGYLLWVQLPAAEPAALQPFLAARPAHGLDAVISVTGRCSPADVIANRLDPWHGVHYHPHSFGQLRVIAQSDSAITVRVAYRVAGPFAVEVDARFECPDARSIVMTIVAGDGVGSVVETHATPIREGLTAIIELTLASSDRPGFGAVRRLAPVLRPVMRWAAGRLWSEDARYAERLYTLRQHAALSSVSAEAESQSARSARGPRA